MNLFTMPRQPLFELNERVRLHMRDGRPTHLIGRVIDLVPMMDVRGVYWNYKVQIDDGISMMVVGRNLSHTRL